MSNYIVVLAVVGVLALFEGIWYLYQSFKEKKKSELRRRLSNMVDDNVTSESGPQIMRNRRLSDIPALDAFLRNFDAPFRVAALLEQTSLEWTVGQVLGGSLGCFFLPFFYFLIFKHNATTGFFIGAFAFFLPLLYVQRERTQRGLALSSQLPEALEMMSRSLRAGHSIQGAFQLVAKELHPPIAVEFAKCYEEQKLGKSVDEAVRNIVTRVPDNTDLKIFAVMVAIQRETGGNMIELLEGIAGTIRDRYNFYGKLRVITSEGRASAAILGSLPVVVGGVLVLSNPEYLMPLINDVVGNIILGMGAASLFTGVFIMVKMTELEV